MLNYKETYLSNYIEGELRHSELNTYIENYNPATGTPYSHLPDSDEADLQKAVNSASKAFSAWAKTSMDTRTRLLLRIADLIDLYADDLSFAESMDNGKPLSLSKSTDIPLAANFCRYYATGAMHFYSESYSTDEHTSNYVMRKPTGIVSCIIPWNMPFYYLIRKAIPALAIGNCVIIKPSEVTPLTAYLFSQICIETGLPPGVLNIVHGSDQKLLPLISKHRALSTISFTGSTQWAKQIASDGMQLFKKMYLETSNINPAIVFSDCNLDDCIRELLRASFTNQGQSYYSISWILVEASIFEAFKNEFTLRTGKLTVGDPMQARTRQGAIASKKYFDKILGQIKKIQDNGGKLLTGGKQAQVAGNRCKDGWFIEPTVFEIENFNKGLQLASLHSPIVMLQSFTSSENILDLVNSSEQGLVASIWTNQFDRAHTLTQKMKHGTIWINHWSMDDRNIPHGNNNNTGLNKDGGINTYKLFTEAKNICIKNGNSLI